MNRLLPEDIDFVLNEARASLERWRGKRLFVTGATGFFGCWLLETLLAANARLKLRLEITALSREPSAFSARVPHLGEDSGVRWVRGEILALTPQLVRQQLGAAPEFDGVIHLVTEANLVTTAAAPLDAIDAICEGTRRALDFALATGATRFLFTSSGAVYGTQPSGLSMLLERYDGAPATTDISSAYGAAGNAKRFAELLCAAYAKQHGLGAVIARCFTFVGPHLPLNGKFAVGNFLQAALDEKDIVIRGDGTSVRSYLYAADLTVWLLALLCRGSAGDAYNVGSESPVSIKELADKVNAVSKKNLRVEVLGQRDPIASVHRYVPSTQRAAMELGLSQKIPLDVALERTLRWCVACRI